MMRTFCQRLRLYIAALLVIVIALLSQLATNTHQLTLDADAMRYCLEHGVFSGDQN